MVTNLLKEISKEADPSSTSMAGLSNLDGKLARLEEELVHARQENKQLREKTVDAQCRELEGVEESKVKSSLIRATRDVVSHSYGRNFKIY